jgi:hypothetical protein
LPELSKSIKGRLAAPWNRLARAGLGWRITIKLLIFIVVVLFAHFPNLVLLGRQLINLRSPERLIQTDFPGLADINRAIDLKLPPNATRSAELSATESYVYLSVPYEFDWDNWGNADYWPTAEEVWARRREDCDGQAVLAASILRSRGFTTATVAGNLMHVWVVVDADELMGPGDEKNFASGGGVLSVALPSWRVMVSGLQFYLTRFPPDRLLLMFLAAIVLCLHPSRNVTLLFGSIAACLVGYVLVLSAGPETEGLVTGIKFALGLVLLGSSPILAAALPRLRL